jgi:hypothetical protein
MLKSGESSEEHSKELLYETFKDMNANLEAKVSNQNKVICFILCNLMIGAIILGFLLLT